MLFRWDNYSYNYNCNYKDDAVPMDVDSNALAHDHNYGKVSLSIELRKNAFFHFMVITMKYASLKKAHSGAWFVDEILKPAKTLCLQYGFQAWFKKAKNLMPPADIVL